MESAIRTTKDKKPSKSHIHKRPERKTPPNQPKDDHPSPRRTATLYDAVAGRVGLNGFLKPSQLDSSTSLSSSLRPEEVLLRRVNAPDDIPHDYYDVDLKLDPETQELPDADLLKDIHGYVSEFYETLSVDTTSGTGTEDRNAADFKSLDETALLAMGILLEEACKETLGENGDMVFSEPMGYEKVLPRNARERYQVVGRVVPVQVEEYRDSDSSGSDEEEETEREREKEKEDKRPRKRARRRYGDLDGL